ncbi:MAG: LpxI family protein, partial [Planctomycetota bacterium]
MIQQKVLGLIAGGGRLPFLVASGAKRSGTKVVCVGLADNAEPDLAGEVDVFYKVAIARPGSWIHKLKRHGVIQTVMVGTVAKSRLFTPKRILYYLPDWRAFRIFYWRLRGKDKRNDTVLCAVA